VSAKVNSSLQASAAPSTPANIQKHLTQPTLIGPTKKCVLCRHMSALPAKGLSAHSVSSSPIQLPDVACFCCCRVVRSSYDVSARLAHHCTPATSNHPAEHPTGAKPSPPCIEKAGLLHATGRPRHNTNPQKRLQMRWCAGCLPITVQCSQLVKTAAQSNARCPKATRQKSLPPAIQWPCSSRGPRCCLHAKPCKTHVRLLLQKGERFNPAKVTKKWTPCKRKAPLAAIRAAC